MATKKKNWGFDVNELDTSIRPQDDFYGYVNSKWKAANPIPKNEARWGTFMILRYETDKKLHSLLTDLMKKKASVGSDEQLVGDFFRSGMDTKRRNELGLAPIKPLLERISKLTSVQQIPALLGYFDRIGGVGVWHTFIEQDAKDSTKYAYHISQDGLGMPDREYYLKDDPEFVRVRTAYKEHIQAIARLMGRTPSQAKEDVETLMRIETRLAHASMKKEDMRDPERVYNKKSFAQLQKLSPKIDWTAFFKESKVSTDRPFIIMQPDFLAEVSDLLLTISLEDWKTYLSWHTVDGFSGALSDRFVRTSFAYYGKVLSGRTSMLPRWRRVLNTVNGGLGELIGKVYAARYFSPESKKRMERLVDDLFVAFEARIRSLTWMTPATKRKALLKLKALNPKIGYPKKWKSYKGLEIRVNDYVGNIIRMNEYEHKRAIKKLNGRVDRDEWFMYPQTVNAYFAPNLNDIVFPAAILQPPFFTAGGDDAVNYGCIGAVIGHEITHGFDDEGSKYDSKGNLKSWWTKEDRKRFEAKAKVVEKQFDTYTVSDGVKVNGKLTLGENIADLGGLSIAYDAYQMQIARTGREDLDGLTPEQRFFIAFAVFERENSRPEITKMQVLTDPHAPGVFRIMGPVSNFNAFYEAFAVKKGDGHYRLPAKREIVW